MRGLALFVILGTLLLATPGRVQAAPNPLATNAIEALEALSSALDVGVTYRDYKTRLIDAKIVVDKFLRKCPDRGGADTLLAPGEKLPAPKTACEFVFRAMADYELAGSIWNLKVGSPDDPWIEVFPGDEKLMATAPHRSEMDPVHQAEEIVQVPMDAYIQRLWGRAAAYTEKASSLNH